MKESMPYRLKLSRDLSGWEPLLIRVRCVQDTASRDPGQPLLPDFQVRDAPDSPHALLASGCLVVHGQRRRENPTEIEFTLAATRKLSVHAAPDRCAMEVLAIPETAEGAAGALATASGAAGGGLFGGILAGQSAARMLAAVCTIEIERPVFSLSVQKYRWTPADNIPLNNLIDRKTIAELNQFGGKLKVPLICNPTQESRGILLQCERNGKSILLHDASATLDWKGCKYIGKYQDDGEPGDSYENHNPRIGLLTFLILPPDNQSPRAGNQCFVTAPLTMDLHAAITSKVAEIHHGATQVESELAGHQVNFQEQLADFNHGLARYLADSKSDDLQEEKNRNSFNSRLINLARFFQQAPTIFGLLGKSLLLRSKVEEAALAALTDLSINCISFGLEHWRSTGAEAKQAETFRNYTHDQAKIIRQEFKSRAARRLDDVQRQVRRLEEEVQILFDRGRKCEHPFLSKEWEAQMSKYRDAILKSDQELLVTSASEESAKRTLQALNDPVFEIRSMTLDHQLNTALKNAGLDSDALEFGRDLQKRMEIIKAEFWEDYQQWEARVRSLPPDAQPAAMEEMTRIKDVWETHLKRKELQPFNASMPKEGLEQLFNDASRQELAEIHDTLRRQQQQEPGYIESAGNHLWAILQPTINAGQQAYQQLVNADARPTILLDAQQVLQERRSEPLLERGREISEACELAEAGGTLAYNAINLRLSGSACSSGGNPEVSRVSSYAERSGPV
jgi:hypothetical protein